LSHSRSSYMGRFPCGTEGAPSGQQNNDSIYLTWRSQTACEYCSMYRPKSLPSQDRVRLMVLIFAKLNRLHEISVRSWCNSFTIPKTAPARSTPLIRVRSSKQCSQRVGILGLPLLCGSVCLLMRYLRLLLLRPPHTDRKTLILRRLHRPPALCGLPFRRSRRSTH